MTKELIAKLEALDGPEASVFWEVFHAIKSENVPQADFQKWMNLKVWFGETIDCQSWESAAIMLKPEGWEYGLSTLPEHPNDDTDLPCAYILGETGFYENANHPAIALLICILKAKEPVE